VAFGRRAASSRHLWPAPSRQNDSRAAGDGGSPPAGSVHERRRAPHCGAGIGSSSSGRLLASRQTNRARAARSLCWMRFRRFQVVADRQEALGRGYARAYAAQSRAVGVGSHVDLARSHRKPGGSLRIAAFAALVIYTLATLHSRLPDRNHDSARCSAAVAC
jgi:hypothetical protein